jgi:hypothetical protein
MRNFVFGLNIIIVKSKSITLASPSLCKRNTTISHTSLKYKLIYFHILIFIFIFFFVLVILFFFLWVFSLKFSLFFFEFYFFWVFLLLHPDPRFFGSIYLDTLRKYCTSKSCCSYECFIFLLAFNIETYFLFLGFLVYFFSFFCHSQVFSFEFFFSDFSFLTSLKHLSYLLRIRGLLCDLGLHFLDLSSFSGSSIFLSLFWREMG